MEALIVLAPALVFALGVLAIDGQLTRHRERQRDLSRERNGDGDGAPARK
jgi:hypothetical protein